MKEVPENDWNSWEFFPLHVMQALSFIHVWTMTSKTRNVYRLDKGLADYDYGKQVLV